MPTPITNEQEPGVLRDILPAAVLHKLVSKQVDGASAAGAFDFLMDIVQGVGPRDPLERMLVQQLAWTNQRVAQLTILYWPPGRRTVKASGPSPSWWTGP